MNKHNRVLVLAVVFSLLVACSTTTDMRRESPSEAAKYNALLGIKYLELNQVARAREKIDRALAADAKVPVTHTAAAMLYERLGEFDRADQHYRTALRLQPDDPELRHNYGVYLCRRDRMDEGEKLILEAARNPLYPTPFVAFTNAGLCMKAAGRMVQAEQHFRTAIRTNPKFTKALAEMALLQYELGDHIQARSYLEQYLHAARELPETDLDLPAMLLLGFRVEQALNNPNAAEAYARRLRTEFPRADQTRALERTTG